MRLVQSTAMAVSLLAGSSPLALNFWYDTVGSDNSSATNGSSVTSVAGKKRLPAKPCAKGSLVTASVDNESSDTVHARAARDDWLEAMNPPSVHPILLKHTTPLPRGTATSSVRFRSGEEEGRPANERARSADARAQVAGDQECVHRVSGRRWHGCFDQIGQDAARQVLQDLALSAVVIERMGGTPGNVGVVVFRIGVVPAIGMVSDGVMLAAVRGSVMRAVFEGEPRQRPRRGPRDSQQHVAREQRPPAAQGATHANAPLGGEGRRHFRSPAPKSSTVTIVVTVPIRWKVSVRGKRSPARSGCLRSISIR